MPLPGSRSNLAIELAADLLSRRNGGTGHIILVTDGIEVQDIPAAENAVGLNRLSILAVGTESGSPIPLSGGGFLKDKKGGIVIPKLYLKPLQKLAAQTHGAFTRLSPDDRDVEQIIAAETAADDFVEDKQQRTSDKWNEEGPWLLLLVLPMAALLFRRGLLFSIGFAVLLGVTASPSSALAFGWDDLWLRPDQQAAKLFQQGETKQAAELFESSEWKGAAAYRSGDYEKAIEHFSQQNHSRANFNSGNALAFAGRLQESLEAFGRVLADNPQDADAQYNQDLIEKLLKEQQKKKQQQEGQQGANQKNKQDQQDGSSQTQEKQNAQSAQDTSGDNVATIDQQTAEGVKNNTEKESTAKKNNEKSDEEKTESPNKEGVQKKLDGSAEKGNAKNKKQDSTPVDLAKQQFLEQWLRKIPDDPGRLLRNKMEREFQRRGKQNFKNEQYW